MKRFVVGGNFGIKKESSIAKKLAKGLFADLFNGGDLDMLSTSKNMVKDYDLVVWMPNIENEVIKNYPIKKKGSVLICSKLLHDNATIGDAVSRIFKMNANAVIAIDTSQSEFKFKLIDALGNLWIETESLIELSKSIESLAYWTKDSIRKGTASIDEEIPENEISENFCDIIKLVSQKVETERGGRYFGNASTRCSYMFPSKRKDDLHIYVSGRNIPKDFIKPEDFVLVREDEDKIKFLGDRKPSVDTPVQIELYKMLPKITHIIHGHAHIKGAPVTEDYYPCGDLREVDSITKLFSTYTPDFENLESFYINLKNHGFIIGGNEDNIKKLVERLDFEYREIK